MYSSFLASYYIILNVTTRLYKTYVLPIVVHVHDHFLIISNINIY